MQPLSPASPSDIESAADAVLAGEVIGFFFNGAYALLCDADQADAAAQIFELKRRPPARTLSLVCDPRFWPEFVDSSSPALRRFPQERAAALHQRLHAVGVVYPADLGAVPTHLVQDGTVLNVWTNYDPLIELQAACRARGSRSLSGASANLSGEPTYTRLEDMQRVFGDRLGATFDVDHRVPTARQNSVSLVDLCGSTATLLREGNTTEAEVRAAVAALGLGDLAVSLDVSRL